MHESVQAFVQRLVNTHDLAGHNVLEIGSININGSVREFFTGDYTGIDLQDGPGVDLVLSAHDLPEAFDEGYFEVVLCLEMLEHDPAPWLTMQAIAHVLKPGGSLIVSTRGNGFPEHNNPDRWRFMKEGMESLLALTGCEVVELRKDPQVPGWFAYCTKR